MKPRHLSHLLQRATNPDPVVTGLTTDSRLVAPGYLFAALPGAKVDGREFIAQAIKDGAAAILAPEGTPPTDGAVTITDAEPRRLFSHMCARFYDRQPRMIAAITGTNGKTSTAQFTRELWAMAGYRAASIGTLGLVAPHITREGSLTTPDTVSLHRDLFTLSENSVTHVAMEASSHGLDQFRLDGVQVKVAGFTNLTRDHLDYHGTMEKYFDAKARLFEELLAPGGTAVLNADSDAFPELNQRVLASGRKVVSYGYNGTDLRLIGRELLSDGQILFIEAFGNSYEIALPLIGEFQAMNALCAAGMVIASGESVEATLANLIRLSSVRGRLELVGTHPNGAAVYVDYAHTPDGLETVLHALRPHTENRLHVVFGAGGDRDRGKRPQMGKVASELADVAIVTDDNPRSEEPASIRAEIMAACPNAAEIGDRALAIQAAVSNLKEGDVLVIAGKGHEQGQIVAGEVRPFDDVSVARFAINSQPASAA